MILLRQHPSFGVYITMPGRDFPGSPTHHHAWLRHFQHLQAHIAMPDWDFAGSTTHRHAWLRFPEVYIHTSSYLAEIFRSAFSFCIFGGGGVGMVLWSPDDLLLAMWQRLVVNSWSFYLHKSWDYRRVPPRLANFVVLNSVKMSTYSKKIGKTWIKFIFVAPESHVIRSLLVNCIYSFSCDTQGSLASVVWT